MSYYKFLFISALLFSGKSFCQTSSAPFGLTVEYIRDSAQVAIADLSPEYSWVVPQSALSQSSFRILVASNKDLLNQNIGDIWDSQKTNSNQSINIEHASVPLKPDTQYFWKVKIWDKNKNPTDFSITHTFTIGDITDRISSQNSFQLDNISPQHFSETIPGNYFIDFGKDAFGTLSLKYRAKVPETLTINLGEKAENEKIDKQPGGSIRYQSIKLKVHPEQQNYRLTLPEDKRNTKKDAIAVPELVDVVLPFRYAEIQGAQSTITTNDVQQNALFYYFEEKQSNFTSSDPILNAVWELCKYSIKATSAFGLYVDGDRERIPYEADAYINQLSHYSVDNEYAIAKQTIEHFMQHPTWPTEWILHTALMFYQDYYYTGDIELISAYYEQLKHKTLIELAREDGLITSKSPLVTEAFMRKLGFKNTSKKLKDIVDWPPSQKDTGWKLATEQGERDGYDMVNINTVVNSFFYKNIIIMAEFANILGKANDEIIFDQLAEKVKTSINNKLFDAKKGIYLDGEGSTHSSLHANMLPLAFNLVPDEHLASVAKFVKSRGMASSVYGAQYLLEGLYNAGEAQYALDLMRATHDRSWYNMIKVGSTITMEAWDMKYKPNADWNHAWGAAPANIISRYLWGIQPISPGFSNVRISPKLADLRSSKIEFPTLIGTFKGRYTLDENNIQHFEITLPANIKATFVISDQKKKIITFNNQNLPIHQQSISLMPGVNKLVIK